MSLEHQLVQSLVKPAMMDIPPPFLIFDCGYEGVPITITRATVKQLMGPAGVYYTVPINAQPHEWEIGGAYIGRLYEGAAVWSLLHNRDWTDAVFDTVTNITAVKDATGIDGVANSATSLLATAANGVIGQSVTLGSAERTSSIFVQRVTGTGDIDFTDDGGSNWTTLTGLSSSAFTRYDITRTQANPDVRIRIVTSGDKINVDRAGLESGDFRTSPVDVGATAAARAADVPTTTDLRWLDPSKGTILTQGRQEFLTGASAILMQVDDGGATDRILLRLSASKVVMITDNSGGDNSSSGTANAISAGAFFKAAGAYQQDDVIGGLDGTLDTSPDTSADLPPTDALTTARFGHNHAGSQYFFGAIPSIKYLPDRHPDIELKALMV